jgi:hypothetical protein
MILAQSALDCVASVEEEDLVSVDAEGAAPVDDDVSVPIG